MATAIKATKKSQMTGFWKPLKRTEARVPSKEARMRSLEITRGVKCPRVIIRN